ncbi:MAG: hypothetical protein NT116_03475 [Candidatus Parcubacteria bacterium]|nr:hypothetical protein [Candidatus Parcubacteria bacterium]
MQKNGPEDEKKPVAPETKAPEEEEPPTDGVTDLRLDPNEDGWADP